MLYENRPLHTTEQQLFKVVCSMKLLNWFILQYARLGYASFRFLARNSMPHTANHRYCLASLHALKKVKKCRFFWFSQTFSWKWINADDLTIGTRFTSFSLVSHHFTANVMQVGARSHSKLFPLKHNIIFVILASIKLRTFSYLTYHTHTLFVLIPMLVWLYCGHFLLGNNRII